MCNYCTLFVYYTNVQYPRPMHRGSGFDMVTTAHYDSKPKSERQYSRVVVFCMRWVADQCNRRVWMWAQDSCFACLIHSLASATPFTARTCAITSNYRD